ncbi:MAG TPA: hypothetical protein VF275_02695 [Gammaproteobacteria bacterium]
MTKEVKFLREINISYRKKPVDTDAPVDVPLTDPGKVFELFSDLQNEMQEKFVECVEDQLPFWVEQLGFAVRDAAGNIVTFADK